jgi:voltage-gated potassium channel
MRKIKHMEDHYIVSGYGRIGKRVAEDLQRAGKDFVVIDRDENEYEAMQEANIPSIRGDSEDEETLREAGIERAYGLIITLPEDSTNVFVTLVARELNPNLFILARTNDVKNRRKLLQAGAQKVVAPSDVGADRMAQVILRPNVDRFMEQVLQTNALGLQMEEVLVQTDAPLAGKSLAASNFRQQFDAIVIAIIDEETGEMKFNPGPHDQIEAGDVLIVLGSEEMIARLRREGCLAFA